MNKVLEPIKLGDLQLKNRLMYLAASQHICNKDFTVSDEYVAYYETLAKHGVGIMVTGATICDVDYPSKLGKQAGLYSDEFIPGLKRVTDAVHKHGSKIFFQLWHPGQAPYGTTKDMVKTCADWTTDEIHDLQRKLSEAAVRAKKSGADGVEWHLAHNYLPEQFLVPLFNKRTDEYGADTVENGMRFSLETIEMIKNACGADFPISAKINGTDVVPGGIDEERLVAASKILEAAGIVAISVSGGGSETDITGMSGDGRREEGWKVRYAELVKKNVSIPVVATGSLRHPEYIDSILRDGKCDMIGIARALFADPEWLEKIAYGRDGEIRHCISCLMCLDTYRRGSSGCSVNPRARRLSSTPDELPQDGNGRSVVVVGAGPAGMQAAITLAERGFSPVVFDRKLEVGGNAKLASLPVNKGKLQWYLDYLANRAAALEIDVRLGTEASAQIIEEMDPYAVIVAAGSKPILPQSIPGINQSHVYARDILMDMPQVSDKNIFVAGVGQVGLEIAETFSEMGNKVTIADMLDRAVLDSFNSILTYMNTKRSGVRFQLGQMLLKIDEDTVTVQRVSDGEVIVYPAELVVMCLGAASDNALYKELAEKRANVFSVGDCTEAGKIKQAVQSGYDTAAELV